MPPANLSSQPARSSSPDLTRGIRKRDCSNRVCRACDRCRLKKGKCDGAVQCSRCKADNAICVFGYDRKALLIRKWLLTPASGRKRRQDKDYPKGYAEMLEQQ
jgi:hypothetical protein